VSFHLLIAPRSTAPCLAFLALLAASFAVAAPREALAAPDFDFDLDLDFFGFGFWCLSRSRA